MTASDLAKKVPEWIFRPAALREARAVLPARDDRRDVALRQARLLLEVARRVTEPGEELPPGAQPAVLLGLYRDAIYWALAARRTDGGELPPDLRALWDASNPQTMAAAPAPDNEESAALRRTLFDEYDPRSLAVGEADAARARAFADALVWDTDAPRRRVAWVLAQRWLRVAAIGLVLLLLVVGIRALSQAPNLAAGRPFRLSSSWSGWAACVAHEDCRTLMFSTDLDDDPWVEIDLGAAKSIRRVDVVNRGKCCEDRAVPLIIELSTDQKWWTQVARRDAVFGSWTAQFRPKVARYVRLKVLKRSMLHLKSITVR
jgi:hypothetical protein